MDNYIFVWAAVVLKWQSHILIMHATSSMWILHEVVFVKNVLTIHKMAEYALDPNVVSQ